MSTSASIYKHPPNPIFWNLTINSYEVLNVMLRRENFVIKRDIVLNVPVPHKATARRKRIASKYILYHHNGNRNHGYISATANALQKFYENK